MNIKIFILLLILPILGCKKNNINKLSDNYYKLALDSLESTDNLQQKYKYALENLDKAILYKAKSQYYALQATILFKLGQEREAENSFKKALSGKLEPHIRADALNNYACLMSEQGRIHEANSIWEDLKNSRYYLTPEVALFNQAKLLVKKGYYIAASRKLFSAIELAPNYIDAHYYLALIANNYLGNKILSKREASIVLALEPDHIGAKRILK